MNFAQNWIIKRVQMNLATDHIRAIMLSLASAITFGTQVDAVEKLIADDWVSFRCLEVEHDFQTKVRYPKNETILIKKDLTVLLHEQNVYDDCKILDRSFRLSCKSSSIDFSWQVDRFTALALRSGIKSGPYSFYKCDLIESPKF